VINYNGGGAVEGNCYM